MSNHESESRTIPTWNGDRDNFHEYRLKAELYAESLSWRDQGRAGPSLARSLTGTAWEAFKEVDAIQRQKLKGTDGVQLLLSFLEKTILDLPIPEGGRLLKDYLFGTKRTSGESMKVYSSRHRTVLARLETTIRKIEKRDTSIVLQPRIPVRPWTRPGGTIETEGGLGQAAELPAQAAELPAEGVPNGVTTPLEGLGGGEEEPWNWQQSWWNWQEPVWGQHTLSSDPRSEIHGIIKESSLRAKAQQALEELLGEFEIDTSHPSIMVIREMLEAHREDIIPSVLQGWLLLMKSGLSPQERAAVLGSAQNSLDLNRIEKALREQWLDEDLRRRDKSHKVDSHFHVDDEETDLFGLDDPDDDPEDEELCAALQAARVTIKHAHEQLRDLRKKRKFFPRKNPSTPSSTSTSGGGKKICARCGSTDHWTREHPGGPSGTARSANCAFSFTVDVEKPGQDEEQAIYASLEEQSAGCLVLDCGATDSVGSVKALEKLYTILSESRKEAPTLEVDPDDRTKFRFGNGHRDTSISRVKVPFTAGGRPGQVAVAILDTNDKYVPLLGGINFLEKSGAVVDFGSSQAVFRAIDETKVVKLQKCTNGLLALNLKEDILTAAPSSE